MLVGTNGIGAGAGRGAVPGTAVLGTALKHPGRFKLVDALMGG